MDKIPEQQIRNIVASQITDGRSRDKQQKEINWNNFRHGGNYLSELRGISDATSYIKNYLPSNKLLDIGAGSTIGTMHLQQAEFSEGLEYWATSLTKPNLTLGPRGIPKETKLLPKERLILTSAEILRGFGNETIAMILAVHSISYSKSIEMVMKRMDDVLIPGGLIKALFRHPDDDRRGRQSENTHLEIVKLLKSYCYPNVIYNIGNSSTTISKLVCAIKPTQNGTLNADMNLLKKITCRNTYTIDRYALPNV